MIASIEKQEKELFNEWRKTTPNLSEDGIVEPKSYLNADIKILFLLKEVNSKEGFNLKEFVRNGGRTQTWDNIAKWTCGIHNMKKEFKWDEIEPIKNIKIRKEWLRFIGVMNIKKTPGGHTSNAKSLWEDSSKDKEFLNRQFKLYYNNPQLKPDLIIACGTQTSNFFHTLIPFAQDKLWMHTTRGVKYYEYETGKFFIKYAHPEARVADNLLYYGLIDAIKELK
ncbi:MULTISPECIES: hypothetical protein [Arenibacter]|uniref:hypothetical protein n=1 Tax=Arenibacter TaxID=178469 RepID=UPI0004DF494B|nr:MULTISPECIES: hypothetical protein [Arenibacter]GBF18028.1 hypothetical protein C21_00184 [Arenibacter sp. NBRC 103722]